MTGIRRALVLAGLTPAIMIGAAIPASATFADTAKVTATVGTVTVAAPATVTVDDSCITTTTTVRRTTRYDSATGQTTQVSYNASSTTAPATYNDQRSDPTETTVAPGPTPTTTDTTTVTVTRNTNLHVTVSWSASQSRGVNGYRVSAHLGAYNQTTPLLSTTATSVSRVEDADALAMLPSVVVTTTTTYGWTADSARTAVLSC
jgi:hypothetical protein